MNQVRAAELLQKAADHRIVRSREELVFNVSSVFLNMLAQRHVIESLAFSRQPLAEHLKRIDALVEAQKAVRVDRMRTEIRLADVVLETETTYYRVLADYHTALAQLKLAMGEE